MTDWLADAAPRPAEATDRKFPTSGSSSNGENPFRQNGDPGPRVLPDPIEQLTDEQREAILAEAARWGSDSQASVERAGFVSRETFLAARGLDPITTLSDYLSAVERFLRRYVAFPSEHEPVAIALYVAVCHLVEQFETVPILALTSAEKRSGKTRLIAAIAPLVPNPYIGIIPSEAVVYTILSQRPRPTFFLDEADTIFGKKTAERYEGIRAILNSGNSRDTPVYRVRMEGQRREVDRFDVFGPKIIAGIGDCLPDTVTDRAIPIRLKRRAPGEVVAKFRRRTAVPEARAITFDWTSVVTDVTVVTVPEGLNDRAADSWEVLLAIADSAGGTWPVRARLAAVALSSDEDTPASVGMRLLADIQGVFDGEDHLTPTALVQRLHGLEDAPWAIWYGKPLTSRELGKLLDPYEVKSVLRRVGGDPERLYFRSDFEDAWERYVLPLSAGVTSVTSVTPPADELWADVADGAL